MMYQNAVFKLYFFTRNNDGNKGVILTTKGVNQRGVWARFWCR